MSDPWIEFATVAIVHLFAVASPGPDFAIVLRQSLAHGRRTATWTSVGVGAAILLHAAYSLLGLGALLSGSAAWFNVIKAAGAVYLAWLGIQALRSKPRAAVNLAESTRADARPTARAAFVTGFLTNALNPKVTLFFVALFATVISPQTPRWVQAGYGIWMAVATAGWFTLIAFAFTRDAVRSVFLRRGHWIDRALGVIFLGFAASLAWVSLG